MKLNVKNFGAINNAELDIGNLTVIAGENSSGKSQLTYSLWKILKKSNNTHKEHYNNKFLRKQIHTHLQNLEQYILEKSQLLPNNLILISNIEYESIINDVLNIIKNNLSLNDNDLNQLFNVSDKDNTFSNYKINLSFNEKGILKHTLSKFISIEDNIYLNMEILLNGCNFINNKWEVQIPKSQDSLPIKKEIKRENLTSYILDILLSDVEQNLKSHLLINDIHFATTERIGAFTFGYREITKLATTYLELNANTKSLKFKSIFKDLLLSWCILVLSNIIIIFFFSQMDFIADFFKQYKDIEKNILYILSGFIGFLALRFIFLRYTDLKKYNKIKDFNQGNNLAISYSEPVYSNIEFTQGLSIITENNSFITNEHHQIIEALEELMGGKLEYHETRGIYFKPSSTTGQKSKLIPYRLLSSSIRSLSYIYFYIKHQVTKNSLFIIDEPEAYLHPENQIKISHIIIMLMNAGVNILITTHSDFMVREINNLIALKRMKELDNQIDQEIYEQYKKCLPNLTDKHISINYMVKESNGYILRNSSVTNSGAEVPSFNDTIDKQINIMEYISSNFEDIEDEYK